MVESVVGGGVSGWSVIALVVVEAVVVLMVVLRLPV